MSLTSNDITEHDFQVADGGFDQAEVRAFLAKVAVSYEEIETRIQRLEERVENKDTDIEQLKAQESEIKEVLVVARRLGKDMERGARREADVIVGEARLEAERILMDATEERNEIDRDIMRMKSLRLQLANDLRMIVETFNNMLDEVDQQETGTG